MTIPRDIRRLIDKALRRANGIVSRGVVKLTTDSGKGQTVGVTETRKFLAQNLKPDYATQSGPMLVIGGKLHPKIKPDGVSEKLRNGVGMCEDGLARFVIADAPVTFFAFASLFLALKCPDALFLDGSISALYSPDIKRNDGWKSIGPIVGVVEGLKKER